MHGAGPARTTVLADAGVLAPADPGDPLVAAVEQVGGGQVDPGRTVDVDPGVVGGLVVPRPAERHERRPALPQPDGLRVAEVGVGDDERVDGRGPQQVVVPAQVVLFLADREQQDVVARAARRLHERVHEPVHRGVRRALLGRAELEADQVRGAGPQVTSRPVGRVAQLLDRLLHAGQGVGAQQVGVVDGVRDGLARDARSLGDVRERRRRDGITDRHRPTSPLAARLDRSKPGRGQHK